MTCEIDRQVSSVYLTYPVLPGRIGHINAYEKENRGKLRVRGMIEQDTKFVEYEYVLEI